MDNVRILSTLSILIKSLNIKDFDTYFEENKLSDNLSEKQINQIMLFLSTYKDLVNNRGAFWDYIMLENINDEHLLNLIELDLKFEQIDYTALKASEETLLKLYDKYKNENISSGMILKRIKTKEVLLSAAKNNANTQALLENKNLDQDIAIEIILTILKETETFHNIKNINKIIEKFQVSEELNTRIYQYSLTHDVPSIIFCELAKQKELSKEVIEGIMYFNPGEETNSYFARTALIHNEFVPEEYKIKILENQNNFPIYNENTANPILDYLTSITKAFS